MIEQLSAEKEVEPLVVGPTVKQQRADVGVPVPQSRPQSSQLTLFRIGTTFLQQLRYRLHKLLSMKRFCEQPIGTV